MLSSVKKNNSLDRIMNQCRIRNLDGNVVGINYSKLFAGLRRTSATKKTKKTVRRHAGVYQAGPKKGKLKKGYKYSGETNTNGLPEIVKTRK